MKKIFIFLFGVMSMSSVAFAADSFNLPPGAPVTFERIAGLIYMIYQFLVDISVVLALGSIIVAGIMWVTAGDSDRIEKAKAILRGGLIGAFIILGAGMIIRTVNYAIGLMGDSSGYQGGVLPDSGLGLGSPCTSARQCQTGLTCDFTRGDPGHGVCAR